MHRRGTRRLLTAGTLLIAIALATGVALATNSNGDRSSDVKRAIEGGKAKNVILLIGDGMGDSEITHRPELHGRRGGTPGDGRVAAHRADDDLFRPGERPVEARLHARVGIDRDGLVDRSRRPPTAGSRRRPARTRT